MSSNQKSSIVAEIDLIQGRSMLKIIGGWGLADVVVKTFGDLFQWILFDT